MNMSKNYLFLAICLVSISYVYAGLVISQPEMIDQINDSIKTSFYVDNSTLHIVYENASGSISYVNVNLSDGNILNKVIITEGNSTLPSIVDSNDKLFILWQAFNPLKSFQSIYHIFTDKKGNNPTSISLLSNDNFEAKEPSATKEYSTIHSVWSSNSSDGKVITYRKYENGYWEEPINVSNPSSNEINKPVIAVTKGNLYFSWINDSKEIIFKIFKGSSNIGIEYTDTDYDSLVDVLEKGYTNSSNSSYNDADNSSTTNYTNYDTDGDGLPDGWRDGWFYDIKDKTWKVNSSNKDGIKQPWEGEDLNLNGRVDENETDPNKLDSDSDGLPDGFEVWYGLNASDNTSINGADGDADSDGLSNINEYYNNTNPLNSDSDGDGLLDYNELMLKSNSLSNDTDNDGLDDFIEYQIKMDGSTINNSDSDGDGVKDGDENYETSYGADNCNFTADCDKDGFINMLDWDSDNDGISDGIEFRNGTNRIAPVSRDTDGDGILDKDEDLNKNGIVDANETDPMNPDSDGDGLWDGNYTHYGGLAYRIYYVGEKTYGTNPRDVDTDKDGLNDFIEVVGWDIYVNDFKYHVTSNPKASLSDIDNLTDKEEYELGTNPKNNDTDGDGYDDYYEAEHNLSPVKADTDGDGVFDEVEMDRGTDPLNPDTDGDGLLDSEGDFVIFRTNTVSSNALLNKTVSMSFDPNDPCTSSKRHEIPINPAPSRIHKVFLMAPVNYTSILLRNSSLPLTENNTYGYNATSGNVEIFIWRPLQIGEKLNVTFESYGIIMSQEFDDVGFSNFSISMASDINIISAVLETPTYEEIELNDYYMDYGEGVLHVERCMNLSDLIRIEYYDVSYSSPENINTWIAVDKHYPNSDLNEPLYAFSRLGEVVLTDKQVDEDGSYSYVGNTPENYSIKYIHQPSIHAIADGVTGNGLKAVAFGPGKNYALAVGTIGGQSYIYKIYENHTNETLLSITDELNSLAWTWDGAYALIVGNNGTLYLYNATSKELTKIQTNTTSSLNAVSFTKEHDDYFKYIGVIVGDGVIYKYDINNKTLENLTISGNGLGNSSYNYIGVSHSQSHVAFIVTNDSHAFEFNLYLNSVGEEYTFTSDPPQFIEAVDWKHSQDIVDNSFVYTGLIVGGTIASSNYNNYLYICNFGTYKCYPVSIPNGTNVEAKVTGVSWNPVTAEALISMEDTGSNAYGGKVLLFNYKTNNFTLLASRERSKFTNVNWHESGDFAYLTSITTTDNVVKDPTMLFEYIKPYVVIDTPGDTNPVYTPIDGYSNQELLQKVITVRGMVPEYNISGGENYYFKLRTNPLMASTYDDGLSDRERSELNETIKFGDDDNDGIIGFADKDIDGDGILNGEEGFYLVDTDNDGKINLADNDSDGDGLKDGDEVTVVFRTNASIQNGLRIYNNSGTWIAVDFNGDGNLEGFTYSSLVDDIAGLSVINYTFLGNATPVTTPEGYLVYKDSSDVYIDLPGNKMLKFVSGASGAELNNSRNDSFALKHLEKYNPSGMLGIDTDNDGLSDSIDPCPSKADCDGDGLLDGLEHDWNSTAYDNDTYRNIEDLDSDNDGVPDGWIDGWCFNQTAYNNGEKNESSIVGYGVYCGKDGIKQPWEGEDLNLDGKTWWSVMYTTSEGEIKQSETNPLRADTDVDGLLDGEEYIYGTDPIWGKDYDSDGITDADEIKSYYMADSIELADYSTSTDKVQEDWCGHEYINLAKIDGATSVKVSLKLLYNGNYTLNLTGKALSGTLNITIINNSGSIIKSNPVTLSNSNRTIYQGYLDAGMYDVVIGNTTGAQLLLFRLTAYKKGLNYNNSDSDGDGLIDGKELGFDSHIIDDLYPIEELIASSPLDPDSDDDGLLDGEETKTSPVNPDSDSDGVVDKYDLMPNANLGLANVWKEVFPRGTLYYTAPFYIWTIDGSSSSVDCTWNVGDHCAEEHYHDLGNEGVLDSPTDLNSKKYVIEKALNPNMETGFGYYDSILFKVENMSPGVRYGPDPNQIRYSISMDKAYTYFKTGVSAAVDAYPYYTIKYHLKGEAYEVTVSNAHESYLVENDKLSWVPTSNASLVGNLSAKDKYVYFTDTIKLDKNKNQYLVLQLSIDPKYDLTTFNYSTGDYIIPAIEYRLYDGNMSWSTGVMSSYAIAKPIEVLATRHSYEFVMSIPREIAKKDQYTLYLSPLYLNVSGDKIKKIPLNGKDDIDLGTASLSRTVDEYTYTLVTKLSSNISQISKAIPKDLSSYGKGKYIFTYNGTSYTIYLYKGLANFDRDFNQSMLSVVDGVILYSDSEAEVSLMLSKVNFTDLWYMTYNQTYDVSTGGEFVPIKVYNSMSRTKQTTYFYNSFYSLAADLRNYNTSTPLNISTENYLLRKYDSSAPYNFSITKNTEEISMTELISQKIAEGITYVLNDLSQLPTLNDQRFDSLKTKMNEASSGTIASFNNEESVVISEKVEGDELKTNIEWFVNKATHEGKATFDFVKGVYDVSKKIYSATKGEVSLGVFQRLFTPPNVPGKFVAFGKGDAISLGLSAIKIGYGIYQAQTATDPISRRAAYESVATTGIETAVTITSIFFPPAAVIQPAWTATYYAIWGPLKILDKLGIIEIEEGPFDDVAKDFGAIVFLVEFESGTNIPSQIMKDAFETVMHDLEIEMNRWYSPALFVPPEV